jgi:hypothetical protein
MKYIFCFILILHSTLHIGYTEKYMEKAVTKKFLGLQVDNHINSKNHIEGLIPKFSAACYAVRSMVQTSNINTVKQFTMHTCIL